MREYDTLLAKGAISYSRMVELLNEKVQKYAKQKAWEAWKYLSERHSNGYPTNLQYNIECERKQFESWWEENK